MLHTKYRLNSAWKYCLAIHTHSLFTCMCMWSDPHMQASWFIIFYLVWIFIVFFSPHNSSVIRNPSAKYSHLKWVHFGCYSVVECWDIVAVHSS